MDNKTYFNDVAAEWDTMRQEFFPESVRKTAFTIADIKTGQTAADIGAGTGFISELLLQNGIEVIAMDQSPAMLDKMTLKFTGLSSFSCRQGSSDALPLEDCSVNAAFANMYLHHVDEPALAIKEMARIIKPGGKLVITDLDKHNFEFLRTEQYDRWLGFERSDILTWFQAAGLKECRVDCIGDKCCADSNCGCSTASITIFAASGVK